MLGNTAKHLLTFRGPLLFAMAAAGHDVTAVGPVEDREIARALASGNVRYQVLPFDRTSLDPVAGVRAITDVARLLRRDRADLFFGYTIKPIIFGAIAARVARVPRRYVMISGVGYTLIESTNLRRRALTRAIKAMYRVALAGCTGVFFQNPDDLREFEALGLLPAGVDRFVVNGSGVDVDAFPCVPLPPGPPVILYMGRLLADKGVRELAAAARLVKQRRPDVTFRIVGHFDPNPASVGRDELDGWIRDGIVEYLGETEDVRPHLAACTALVLPSYREGTPRSVLEALSTGRPVVVTDVPGCRETVVHGDNGFLVPPFQAEPLADAIVELLADRARLERMAASARALAVSKYDARAVAASMLAAMKLSP